MYDQKSILLFTGVRGGAGFGQSFSLNAANLKYDIAFQLDAAMTIAKVAFKVASITGSPTCTVRIETDSAGRASGTLAWANATATGVALSAGWTSEIALTASGSGATATLYHLVIINDNGTPASNFFSVQDQNSLDNPINGYLLETSITTWTASFNGTVWANRFGPIFMLFDGVSTRFGQPFDTTTIQTMNATTGYGVKFTCPSSGSVVGVLFSHLPNTGIGTVTCKLYDISDILLGTATLTAGATAVLSGRITNFLSFDSGPVSVTTGSVYRCVFFDSGSADRLEWCSAPSTPTNYTQVYPTAQDVQWTQGSVGAWTDTPGKLPVDLMVLTSAISAAGGGLLVTVPTVML